VGMCTILHDYDANWVTYVSVCKDLEHYNDTPIKQRNGEMEFLTNSFFFSRKNNIHYDEIYS
jgi:hypothetical protein